MFTKLKKINQNGTMLIITMTAASLFIVIFFGAINLAILQQKLNMKKIAKSQALHIAEAGVNYYRWVLYHDGEEYCNHESCLPGPDYGPYGPYDFTDSSNNIIGQYELYITPPPQDGSTIVKITSVGWTNNSPNVKRRIEVNCGIKSWSDFSVLSNSDIRFGEGTITYGEIHSNNGIRFDGVANHIVSSSVLDYKDPDHLGNNEFGVHTHTPVDPLPDGNNPPLNVPDVPAVFVAGREFPKTIISFDLLDNYANEILDLAEEDGIVVEASHKEGYHITLNEDDTLDIKTVTSVGNDCKYQNSGWKNSPTLRITGETDYLIGTTTPPNGLVFVKDHVWIDGKINGTRISILAFDEPLGGSVANININNDLLYTNYNGTDVIGLIAQNNINVGLYSDTDLTIDAAMIAKEGRIGRYYYSCTDANNCSSANCIKLNITINGSLATRDRYGFRWDDTSGNIVSGYTNRVINFDDDLKYAPPPHFPTTGEYTFISWYEE